MKYINEEIERLNIEERFKKNLYFENAPELSIKWGMNYITFSPSKRIRPLLLLESNLSFSDLDDDSYLLSTALELIHTYSLVHDALPCMDNDDLRRGQPTLHNIKNEGYAVLVGDALLTRAFEILSGYSKLDKISKVIKLFAMNAGYHRLIHGQFLDMEGEGKKLSLNEIDEINKNKTGSLFELALMSGAINGNANAEQIENMRILGTFLGNIFQLKDDVLDIIGDDKEMGKNSGSDEKKEKASIPRLLGIKESINLLNKFKEEALQYIKKIPNNNAFFNKLLEYIIDRVR